jgi:hypothetical protein
MTTVRALPVPTCAQLPDESAFLSDKASIATG